MNRLRFRHSSLASVFRIGFLLASAACTGTAADGGDGKASFTYGRIDQSLAQPMAAGATTTMSVSSQLPVAKVTSSDLAVLTIGTVTGSNSTNLSFPLTAAKPGTATVTLYGPENVEVDQATVTVAPITDIAIDSGGASDVTVLVGDDFTVHAAAEGSGGGLVGDGAVHVGREGVLVEATGVDGEETCTGDCGTFHAAVAGDGQVILRTATVTKTLVVHVVDPSAVDQIDFSPSSLNLTLGPSGSGEWPYTLTAAGTPVHGGGIQCVSSDESIATAGILLREPSLGSGPNGSVAVFAEAAGSATVTCSMNAATPHTWTIPVTVQ